MRHATDSIYMDEDRCDVPCHGLQTSGEMTVKENETDEPGRCSPQTLNQ